jgi:hypothetical protein
MKYYLFLVMKEHMICERAVDSKSFGASFIWAGLKMTEICQLSTVDQLFGIPIFSLPAPEINMYAIK